MSDEQDYMLVMTTRPGYWGRGSTVAEAIKNAKWINGGDQVRVIRCTPEAYVDELGWVFGIKEVLGIGTVARNKRSVKDLTPEVR